MPKQKIELEKTKSTLLNKKNNESFKGDIIFNSSNNNQLEKLKNSGNIRVNNKEKDNEIFINLDNNEKEEDFF